VTVHARFQKTHTGALGDIPPTGNYVSQPFIITYRLAEGKIVEHWMSFDQLALMQQLGVIPSSESSEVVADKVGDLVGTQDSSAGHARNQQGFQLQHAVTVSVFREGE
jgi:hypothetical protein